MCGKINRRLEFARRLRKHLDICADYDKLNLTKGGATLQTATIFNIQHFSIHDGPGIRTTVFFKACNLRCRWCHNPESHSAEPTLMYYRTKCIGCGECLCVCPKVEAGKIGRLNGNCISCGKCAEVCFAGALEISGRKYSVDEVFDEIMRDASLYQSGGGGVTFSGGEPLLHADFLAELLSRLKVAGIHTAIETALCVPRSTIEKVLPFLDLMMCDIKCIGNELHREHTGMGNETIMENIRYVAGKLPMILRTPIVPDFNDNETEIGKIARFIADIGEKNYELLPFSGICRDKYDALGMEFRCRGIVPPTAETMKKLGDHAASFGLNVKIN